MHDRKAEFALCQVLAKALIFGVLVLDVFSRCTYLVRLKIHVVITNLEPNGDEIDEGNIVAASQVLIAET